MSTFFSPNSAGFFFHKTSFSLLRVRSVLVLVEDVGEIYVRVLAVLFVPPSKQPLAFLVGFFSVDIDVVSREDALFFSSSSFRHVFAREESDFVFFGLV